MTHHDTHSQGWQHHHCAAGKAAGGIDISDAKLLPERQIFDLLASGTIWLFNIYSHGIDGPWK